jgi:uncharacterized coiled-coil DUF342 family protein
MKNYKPILVLGILLAAIGCMVLWETERLEENRINELVLRIRQLERRNNELYQQVETLDDELDACSHDLQDCFRREEERSQISPR